MYCDLAKNKKVNHYCFHIFIVLAYCTIAVQYLFKSMVNNYISQTCDPKQLEFYISAFYSSLYELKYLSPPSGTK